MSGLGNRRWWLLGGMRQGDPIGTTHHYVDGDKTACGKPLPIGRFIAANDTQADRERKRCPACVAVRKP